MIQYRITQKSFIFFIALLLFMQNNLFSSKKSEKILDNILTKFEQYQAQSGYKVNMKGAECPVKYELFMYFFDSNKKLTMDESRKHIIESVEKLLHDLNSEKKIQNLFETYPQKPENICIYYYYTDLNRQSVQEPYVSVVWIHKDGKIHYEFISVLTKEKINKTETYDEAYQKVYGRPRL